MTDSRLVREELDDAIYRVAEVVRNDEGCAELYAAAVALERAFEKTLPTADDVRGILARPSPAPEPPPPEDIELSGAEFDALMAHEERAPQPAPDLSEKEAAAMRQGVDLAAIDWAAQPAPDLDVERLGLVLCQQRKHTSYGGRGLARVYPTPPCGGHRNEAAAIAAEYTRLLHARSGRSR